MKKIKYLTPILGLTAAMSVVAPIATSCAKAETSTVLPVNLMRIDGITFKGVVEGTDLTKYDTIEIPEGVQIIDEGALYETNSNADSFDYTTIKTLKLPASVREIRALSLVALKQLTTLDLTSWTPDTIHYVQLDENCLFKSEEVAAEEPWLVNRYLQIKLVDGLTMAQTSEVKTKWIDCGAQPWWFKDLTTDHIGVKEGQAKELTATCNSDKISIKIGTESKSIYGYAINPVSFTLTEAFDSGKYNLNVYPEIKSATHLNVDTILNASNAMTFASTKEATMGFNVFNEAAAHQDAPTPEWKFASEVEGDTGVFDLNFVCTRKDTNEVMWVQKLEGFKFNNEFTHVNKIAIADTDKAKTTEIWLDGSKDQLAQNTITVAKPTFDPVKAVDQGIAWTNAEGSGYTDQWIAKLASNLDGTATILPHGFGSTTITATSHDGAKTDSFPVNVVGVTLKETSSTLETQLKWVTEVTEEDYSQGLYLPSGEQTVKYTVKLDGTFGGLITPAGQIRCFAPGYVNGQVGNVFTPFTGIEETSINIVVTHADGSSETLQHGSHWSISSEGWIKFTADVTLVANDTLTFTIKFNNADPIYYTGFKAELRAA